MKKRGEAVRNFILNHVEAHSKDIVAFAAKKLSITRSAVHKHMKRLRTENFILTTGTKKSMVYSLCPLVDKKITYELTNDLEEDKVWRSDIKPLLYLFRKNVLDIWSYCFTEILNNAIDHSDGGNVVVQVIVNPVNTVIYIIDNGEGIFRKIKREMGLENESHAVLELAKGKLTTDPKRHTGEGIFFSSRMVDFFVILSNETAFAHDDYEDIDIVLPRPPKSTLPGTAVIMKLKNNSTRRDEKVFDKYTAGDEDHGFNKTVIPVRLVQYGDDFLVSRSQAKRLLARVDRFKIVVLDFEGVEKIGQAFSDEIFRVFKNSNKDIELVYIKANADVKNMIKRALSNS